MPNNTDVAHIGVVSEDGAQRWTLGGESNREDGPAVEHTNGFKEWWLDGDEIGGTYAQLLNSVGALGLAIPQGGDSVYL